MLRLTDDGLEVTAEPGRGSVRLHSVKRPWDDEVLDIRCELADGDFHAAKWIRMIGGDGLDDWTGSLAASYRGWDGIRSWESLEHDLRIDAGHDGRGHVALRFTIRGPNGDDRDAWTASVVVSLDAGEDMLSLTSRIAELVAAS